MFWGLFVNNFIYKIVKERSLKSLFIVFFYQGRKVFETIFYFEETLVLAPDKASQ